MRLSFAALASFVVLFAATPALAGGRALPGMNGTSLNGGLPALNGASLTGGLPTMNGSQVNAATAPLAGTGVTTSEVVAVQGRLILR